MPNKFKILISVSGGEIKCFTAATVPTYIFKGGSMEFLPSPPIWVSQPRREEVFLCRSQVTYQRKKRNYFCMDKQHINTILPILFSLLSKATNLSAFPGIQTNNDALCLLATQLMCYQLYHVLVRWYKEIINKYVKIQSIFFWVDKKSYLKGEENFWQWKRNTISLF